MPLVGSAGIYRTATVAAFTHVGLWTALVLIGEFSSVEGARRLLVGTSVGGHILVWWLRWAFAPFLLWLLVDLIFVRRAPPEVRKAQWGTSILALPIYACAATFLDLTCSALEFGASLE